MNSLTDRFKKPTKKPGLMKRTGDAVDRKPMNRPTKVALIALCVLLAYALPILNIPGLATTGTDFAGTLFTCASYALIALGLNIVIGYAGLLDLGYVGFYAVGAYTTGVLTAYHGAWPFFLVLPIAIVVTMISGVILGAPTLRVRGDYLAIVTLGFGEIIRLVVTNADWLGGAAGIKDIPPPPSIGPNPPGADGGIFAIPHLDWSYFPPLFNLDKETHFLKFGVIDAVPYYWLVLTALFIVIIGDILIKNSRVGRAWEATREDEDAAEVMGVPTFRYKLLAFALGAGIGGLSGSLYATRTGYINPQTFVILLSQLFVAAVIIGGSGNRWGAIAGGVLVAYLPEKLRFQGFDFNDWRIFAFGLAMLLLAIWRPQGLFPPGRTRRAKRAEAVIEELEGDTANV